MRTKVSPSGKGLMVEFPRGMPMYSHIDSARGALDVPLKIFTMPGCYGQKQKSTQRVEKSVETLAARDLDARKMIHEEPGVLSRIDSAAHISQTYSAFSLR